MCLYVYFYEKIFKVCVYIWKIIFIFIKRLISSIRLINYKEGFK